MGQVPAQSSVPYLIIGNGRLAKHTAHYFNLSDIPYLKWHRKSEESLTSLINYSQKIIVLINDDEIENIISSNIKGFEDKTWIHCSGLLSISTAESAHPLMTFTNELYDLPIYEQIPFITENGKKCFKDLFPELNNPAFEINPEHKAMYHAWCVMSGNFTTILWNRFFDVFESKFGIDRKNAFPYLSMTAENLMTSDCPLTGPLARGDKKVIEKNLFALKDEPFAEIYGAFVNTFNKMKNESESRRKIK